MTEDKRKPRISVFIITYNQEDVIDRTLDSILSQREYVYEICVSDDHSSDKTWEILQEYNNKYPGLFKLNRNNPNLGIFENTEKVWTMPSGDIVYDLAGDDCVGEGWFKTVIEYIRDKNIDYQNELFCIYGDYKCIYPNGDSIVFSQSAINTQPNNALRLAIRGIIGGRGCCFSKKILDKFENVSKGGSHEVEQAQDRQLQIQTERNYYISKVANIYFANVGVSTQIQNELVYKERLEIWSYLTSYLESKGIILCKTDLNYGNYSTAMKVFRNKRTLVNFIKVINTYIKSRDFSLPQGNSFKHVIFAIMRRLPHTKPFHF